MAQVKVYGRKSSLERHREGLSSAIHSSVVKALNYPQDKKFHRFIALEDEDFIFPGDRSDSYTIIELSMFQGRSSEAKQSLIRALFANIERECRIAPQDIEITIFETPRENWGIRGKWGDELALAYKVNV
jgi:phenylpyruvate tautomerase PptA (4-oxalocrotonate tautomerase family)